MIKNITKPFTALHLTLQLTDIILKDVNVLKKDFMFLPTYA